MVKPCGIQDTEGRRHLYAGQPWQRLSIDMVGPMSITPLGNRWILVLTDHFTRWQDALPLPDATTPTMATALEGQVFCYCGILEVIYSDQGPNMSLR